MKKNQVIMRRSAAKMWLLGLAGIPMLIIAVEYIWRPFGFADKLGEWAYRGGDVEAFEIRDDVLIGGLALVGALFVVISVKELLTPRKMVVANEAGMRFALSGPLKKPSEASWLQIKDLIVGKDSMIVQLHHRGEIPDDPWGARWVDASTLEIRASMWERVPEKFINQIADLGLPTAVREQAIKEGTLGNLDQWSGELVAPPPAPLPVEEPRPEEPDEPEDVTDPAVEASPEQIEPPSVTLPPPPPTAGATDVTEGTDQFEKPPAPQPEETPNTSADTL